MLAQSNVWERSEKQMAALRMEGGRKGGAQVMMSQPTIIICAAHVFILSTSFFHPPIQRGNGVGWSEEYRIIMTCMCTN